MKNDKFGAEYHRKYRAKNRDKCNENARRYKAKVRALKQANKSPTKVIKVQPIGIEALRYIVAKQGKCEGLSCLTCPLNHRETCKNSEIMAEAERLLSEKAIRD